MLSFPAQLTAIKEVSRCPAMGMVSKGRNRHCCPNKQNKGSLAPPHLPDLQLGKAGQKPSLQNPGAQPAGEDHTDLIFTTGFK